MSMIIYQVTVEENSNIKDKEKPRSIPQYRITWSNPGDARGDFFFQPEPVGIQHDMATIWRFPEQYDHLE